MEDSGKTKGNLKTLKLPNDIIRAFVQSLLQTVSLGALGCILNFALNDIFRGHFRPYDLYEHLI